MNDKQKVDEFCDALDQAIGPNDYPDTKYQKTKALREKFDNAIERLRNGTAYQLDVDDGALTIEALSLLRQLLTRGHTPPEIVELLATGISEIARSGDEKIARLILALPPLTGRPSKKLNEQRAIAAYELYRREGYPHATALEEAWSSYYPERQLNDQKSRPQGKSNAYEESLKNVIIPILKQHQVYAPDTPARLGRPKKSI